jgi:hypothetical protein
MIWNRRIRINYHNKYDKVFSSDYRKRTNKCNSYAEILTSILERFQSKALRMVADAPWYVPKVIIRQDLQILSVKEEIRRFSIHYSSRLQTHPNSLTVQSYGTTRTQATETTPTNRSDHKIPRVNVSLMPRVSFVTINYGRAPLGAPLHGTLTQPSR